MATADDEPTVVAPRPRRLGESRSAAVASIVLLVAGVALMVVPGLLRDGVCGLFACADRTPDVAVGRPEGTDLAVVVPEDAAGDLQSLRLFQLGQEQRRESPGDWIVVREDEGATPTVVTIGEEPDGFSTTAALEGQPESGTWVVEASFGCNSTLVRFSPTALDPGMVTTGDLAPETVEDFRATASADLHCSTEAPQWQRWLFFLGALCASVGAVLGIVVVLRKPVPDDPDWFGP
jgi:hypothetical protein